MKPRTLADLPAYPIYPLDGPPPEPAPPRRLTGDRLTVAQCAALAFVAARKAGDVSRAEVYCYCLYGLTRAESDYVLETLVAEGRLVHRAVPWPSAPGGVTHRYSAPARVRAVGGAS